MITAKTHGGGIVDAQDAESGGEEPGLFESELKMFHILHDRLVQLLTLVFPIVIFLFEYGRRVVSG